MKLLLFLGVASFLNLGCGSGHEPQPAASSVLESPKLASEKPGKGPGAAPVHPPGVSKATAALPSTRAELRPFPKEFRVDGEVFQPARRPIELTPPSAGRVADVSVHVGDRVDRDQTLAVIEDVKGNRTSLYALYGGRIQGVETKPGAPVKVDQTLFSLDQLHADWVIAHVKKVQAKALRPGMSARIAGTDLVGSVEESGEEPDSQASTLAVACLIPNESGHLKQGRKVTVLLEKPGQTELRVGLPLSAVTTAGSRHRVHLLSGSHSKEREVELGRRAHGWVEIVRGLRLGDRIALRALSTLRG